MVLTKEEVAGYASWKAAGTPLAMFLESCQQLEGAFVDFLEAEGEILRKGRYFQLVNTSSSDARGPAFLTFVRRYNGWRVWESCGMGRPLLDWSDAELGIWSSCEWNIYPQILPPAGVPVLVSNGKRP